MNEARLQALIAAYGANPQRWPEAERAAAEALLAASPAVRARLAEEDALDRLLAAAPAGEVSSRLLEQIYASAPPPPAALPRPRKASLWSNLRDQIRLPSLGRPLPFYQPIALAVVAALMGAWFGASRADIGEGIPHELVILAALDEPARAAAFPGLWQ